MFGSISMYQGMELRQWYGVRRVVKMDNFSGLMDARKRDFWEFENIDVLE